jgi:hypothetical protein
MRIISHTGSDGMQIVVRLGLRGVLVYVVGPIPTLNLTTWILQPKSVLLFGVGARIGGMPSLPSVKCSVAHVISSKLLKLVTRLGEKPMGRLNSPRPRFEISRLVGPAGNVRLT